MGTLEALNRLESILSSLEERRVVDICRFFIPRVEFAFWGVKVLPHL